MKRLLLALAVLSTAAGAQTQLDEARFAMERGQHDRALMMVDSYLKKKRGDAEGRFLKGLTLVMLERDDEALQVFSDLVRDHPELPEPYNNLAVLYARAGKYEQAQDALETALIKHPSYATAHENLGDIYASMAQAAWNRAAVLDRNNVSLQSKLDMIGSIVTSPAAAAGAKPAPAPVVAAATPPPVASTPRPRPTAAPAADAGIPQMQPVLSAAAALPASANNDPAPALAAPAALSAQDRTAVISALQGWAAAWSAQQTERYLASYSNQFNPGRNLSLETWKDQRRARLSAPASISVQVINPVVESLGGDRVRVRFVQVYQSSSYADQVSKSMELRRENGVWRITREDVLS